MSGITVYKAKTFIGESKVRLAIFFIAGSLLFIVSFRSSLPYSLEFKMFFQRRSEEIFSSAFTFLSVFWAAMLTIWSMLKSRATRYVERISSNVIFREFVSAFEIRLVMALIVILVSFFLYIVNPIPSGFFNIYTLTLWAFLYSTIIILLIDSLLNARIVLD